ncbi:DUF808 domain-containing protein [Puniceibacterium sp. IMCC21224]|uniref:DUF808 domain-containing protein n=1 Tax=Puniceibacterium sp. IMCC21224 TaxID=1618204 RepID=UPI00064DB983|nr:DUF808 domain-containing protein [Puniceibacterium sp. IMCC21224]KMK67409.1 hypothetical protein IMCC21224_112278 [Puniceibacterium sp. IMCC21224]
MSGLLALLDDVAGIAKIAAASVDDVMGQAVKAGSKAAGALIDDAAVTPKYVHGFAAARELPIIWRIARGSLTNKLVYLLPAGLLLTSFAPWLIAPLLMVGGLYLCFEGAEKIAHAIMPHDDQSGGPDGSHAVGDPTHLEEEKVQGAIKTDFILSAEIMTIALAAIPPSTFWMEAATLATVAVMITLLVYGSVALIVKMDDIGLWLAQTGQMGLTRSLGRGIVKMMPVLMRVLSTVGTAAMLWVGGSIVVHGVGELGWHLPEEFIHRIAVAVADVVPETFHAAAEWVATAAMDGVLGVALGLILIPVGTRMIAPLWGAVFGGEKPSAH